MFGKSRYRSVRLALGPRELEFQSPSELDYLLSGKTGLSSLRIAALGNLSDDALAREGDAFNAMRQRIVESLSRSTEAAGQFLATLDLATVSEDNDWRAIFGAIRGLDGPDFADYKRAALVKYIDYLASGQELVRTLRANRRGAEPAYARGPSPSLPAGTPGEQTESARQTLIFDLDEIAAAGDETPSRPAHEFNRMAKGETLDVEFGPHQSLDILLAKHRFTIVSGTPFLLFDEHGHDRRFRFGKNIVGRSTQCDVAIDASFRAVSRKHLIVETDGSGHVRLTDISTLGSFVPREYLDNRLH